LFLGFIKVIREESFSYNVFMFLKALLVGFLAGYFSGQFGIGGGLVATPFLRMFIGLSPTFSIGTTLPPIIPGAIMASFNFYQAGFRRFSEVKKLALFAFFGVIFGAGLVKVFGGKLLMIITSGLIILASTGFIFPKPKKSLSSLSFFQGLSGKPLTLPLIGFLSGAYSALLGLGGGFVLIPGLVYFYRLDIKEAISLSLFTMPFIVFPATLLHTWLGDVNWYVASGLLAGVLPGSYLGSKVALALNSRLLKKLFGFFLLAVGLIFLAFEVGVNFYR
jgi:uncharacterized membrane protein YfcA